MSIGAYVRIIDGANAGLYGYVLDVFKRDVRVRLTTGTTVTVSRSRIAVID